MLIFLETDKKVQKAFDAFAVYKEAIARFGENLADIIKQTKSMVDEAAAGNKAYDARVQKFLDMCRGVINSDMDERGRSRYVGSAHFDVSHICACI